MTGKIELNDRFKLAIDLIENTNQCLFITGKAGTGKSTLLQYFREKTKKKIVVLAPTGVAALNVKGQTIHSFFRFKPDITIDKIKKIYKNDDKNIYKKIDAIIIDEISMVRADLFDCIDKAMQINCSNKKPFGGKQIILIGDLYQLPPVVLSKEKIIIKQQYNTPYFFSSAVIEKMKFKIIELEKIYRQKDIRFIKLLNEIRNNTITNDNLNKLNERYDLSFIPNDLSFYIWLTTRNDRADQINIEKLNELKGKKYQFNAIINGSFQKSHYPVNEILEIKKNAQVMFLNNDSYGLWVNGTIGEIKSINKTNGIINVRLQDGEIVEVMQHTWEIFNYVYNEEEKKIDYEKIGSFTQYPIKLAWAITIHKSQGKSFDNVIIDIGKGTFAPGQMYVALSRCTSFEGLVLRQKIKKSNIFTDWQIVKYMTNYQYEKSEKEMSLNEKIEKMQDCINKGKKVKIIYLKTNDTKTERTIKPKYLGSMQYMKKNYTGIEAFCYKRNELRNFRVDRILKMEIIE